ncbi:hypothetical protein MUNTM_35210 [Mycobacterium sp. MUNTM1]
MEKFDPIQALVCIERYQVFHAQFVPAKFVRILNVSAPQHLSYDISSLQRVAHAAAPCPVEVKRPMIEWFGPLIDEYHASSEAIGASFITAEEWLQHPGSVGRPLVGVAHVLDDESGYPFEYLGDPAKTAAARRPDGMTTVGDMGYLDSDGFLYLTDRRHYTIISGGVNIYPQEAENRLISHPNVMDAAVFGIPDADMGQSAKAVVQAVDPAENTEDLGHELSTWIQERLAHYKCARSISFEDTLPRTDAGKLYKQTLVDKYSAL